METELPDASVWMIHHDLARAPHTPMAAGYTMRPYQEGDRQTWLAIQSHDPFFVPTAEHFTSSMPGDTATLAARVMFLTDPDGADIGTITAWSNDKLLGRPIGQIHWVAIVPEARGRGLARPMLSAACERLRALGYREACLDTNTRRIPALNLYLQFGFVPFVRDQAERAAWVATAPRLKVPVELAEPGKG